MLLVANNEVEWVALLWSNTLSIKWEEAADWELILSSLNNSSREFTTTCGVAQEGWNDCCCPWIVKLGGNLRNAFWGFWLEMIIFLLMVVVEEEEEESELVDCCCKKSSKATVSNVWLLLLLLL